MDFKYMKKTAEGHEGCFYAPWVPVTTATSINNVRVWDHRWWMNILCKINWFFHFRLRRRHGKWRYHTDCL